MGEEGRYPQENYLALRASQLRGECPHKRSEHQDRFKPLGTHLGENDRKVSSCRGQPQAGRNQFPRRNKLCSRVSYANQKAKSVSPKGFIGFFFSPPISMKNKNEKWRV